MAVTVSSNKICGFCASRNHAKCAIGVKHQGRHDKYPNGIVWACPCEQGGCESGRRKCAVCNNTNTEEVDPQTWECFDVEACKALVETRRENSPFLTQLREIKENVMAKVENDKATAKANATPKEGTCVCCGGKTKGGSFLPGHDARFVSGLVGTVTEANFTKAAETSARKSLKDAGASEKLTAKFGKSLGLAKGKAEQKAADAKAKADAKKEKATASA